MTLSRAGEKEKEQQLGQHKEEHEQLELSRSRRSISRRSSRRMEVGRGAEGGGGAGGGPPVGVVVVEASAVILEL